MKQSKMVLVGGGLSQNITATLQEVFFSAGGLRGFESTFLEDPSGACPTLLPLLG